MNPIWKIPILLPVGIQQTEFEISSRRFYDPPVIIFQLQHDGIYLPVSEWENNQYRYRCLSCYCACGSDKHCFVTRFEKAQHLKEGPTVQQRNQMSEHAKQHTIMYSWVKGLK